MKQNFEQDKSVSYRLLASRFVIPWKIEDAATLHAEIAMSDEDTFFCLIPEEDFTVDNAEGWLNLEKDFPEAKGVIIHIYEGARQQIAEHVKRPDAYKGFEDLKNAVVSTNQKIQEFEKLKIDTAKKGDLDRLESKLVAKEDLKNLATTEDTKRYLAEEHKNIYSEIKNHSRKILELQDKLYALQTVVDNKLSNMGDYIKERIKAEKDPRYGELIGTASITKVGDIYTGDQIRHWIYGEVITPPLTPEERLKKWRVVRDHAGTGKYCRGAFIEHNG